MALVVPDSVGQVSLGGIPPSFTISTKTSVPTIETGTVDTPALLKEDSAQEQDGASFRFGYPFDGQYDLTNSGIWETLSDGAKLWRLRISSPGAYSINLLFDRFRLPEGARFFIYNDDRSQVIGAFSSQNNKSYSSFATAPVRGNASILEYYVPRSVAYPGEIRICRIVHAYRDVFFGGHSDDVTQGLRGFATV